MDVHEFRRFANATIDYLVDYLETIRDREVLPPVSPGYLQPLIPKEVPQLGEKWEDVLRDMDRVIMPGVTHWHSPQFHAYYPTSNSYPGIVGEMLCAGIGCLGAEWESSPACTELEVAVMDWLGKALGLPKVFLASEGVGGGIIQGSASEATLVNLFAAKERMLRRMEADNPRLDRVEVAARMVSYTSDQSNSSVEKAGLLGSMPMRLLRGDAQCRLRGPALEAAIQEDKDKGFIPCYVVATLGTTGTCAFDALDEIGPICERHGIWLHVDAAYAGAAFICPEFRHHMRGVEMADSFNFNPHKWMLVNADCSAMWVKDSSWLVDAFTVGPRRRHRAFPDFHAWQIPADRRFRAIKLWLVLRIYGVQGLQVHIRKQVDLARQFETLVDADPRFSVATDVLMGVVCFRLKGPNELTERLITRLTLRRRIYLVSAFVGEELVIRFVVCSRYSEPSDINLAWTEILQQAEHVLASPVDDDFLPVQVSPKDLLSVGLNSCNRQPGGVGEEVVGKGSPAWGSDSSGICVDGDGSWDDDSSHPDGEDLVLDDGDVDGSGWGDGKLFTNNNEGVVSLEEHAERAYSTMDAAEFRKFGKATVDYLADYIENVRDRPVLSVVSPGYLQPLIPEEVPQQGEKWEDVLQDMDRVVMPGVTHWHSPQFHAYYPTANSYPGIVGEMLSAGIGCVGFSWITSPACTELEVAMMDWLGKLLALPKEFLNCSEGPGGGVIQGSASEATLVGLLAAKDRMLRKIQAEHPDWEEGAIKGKMVAYTSDQSNSSVEKAGLLGSVPMRLLRSDVQCRLRGHALEAAIREDRAKGLIPCYVVATLGTTGTCAFDDLEELGQICEREGIWLHVDAAYAGAAFICPEYRHHMQGVELADSFNFNPHKWMLVNFDCSAMWVKDSAWLVDAFNVDRIYLKHHQQGVMPDYRHWQIPLGRRFRSLKLWLVLRIYGVQGLQAHIRKQIALTQRFESLADADARFSVVTRVSMGVVCFRLKGPNGLTKRLLDRLTARKKIYLVSAKVQEDLVIRFVICSRLTEERDVDFAWEEILSQAAAVLSRSDDEDLLAIPSEPLKSNGTTNGTINGISNGTTNGISNGTTNGISNGTTNGISKGTTNGISNGTTNGISNGTTNGISKGTTNGISNGTTNGISNGKVNGSTNGHSNGHTNGYSNGAGVNGKAANGHHNGNGVASVERAEERKVDAIPAKQMKVCEGKQSNGKARLLARDQN